MMVHAIAKAEAADTGMLAEADVFLEECLSIVGARCSLHVNIYIYIDVITIKYTYIDNHWCMIKYAD